MRQDGSQLGMCLSHPGAPPSPNFTVYFGPQNQGRKSCLFDTIGFLICPHSSQGQEQPAGLWEQEGPPWKGGPSGCPAPSTWKGQAGFQGGWEAEGRDSSPADTQHVPHLSGAFKPFSPGPWEPALSSFLNSVEPSTVPLGLNEGNV